MAGGNGSVRPSGESRSRDLGRSNGFTLIELLVVMAIVAMLLTLAIPKYFQGVETAKEAVLREDLRVMRETIDKYYGDTGHYPDSLTQLVDKKYLRAIPIDPIAGPTAEWKVLPPDDPDQGKVYDVKSAAPGSDRNGARYADY
ncbi:type II secretion system protein [Burkholderia ambifaria]|uniref:type II secretion system protein n=1 Tax=Burkholderia ambifaria TaxID=152480 RepID=UPI0022352D04|nr:type II secretion system protein [Burkholderia ambifaria]